LNVSKRKSALPSVRKSGFIPARARHFYDTFTRCVESFASRAPRAFCLRAFAFPPIAGMASLARASHFSSRRNCSSVSVAKNFVLLRAGRMSYSLRSRPGSWRRIILVRTSPCLAMRLPAVRICTARFEAGKPDPSSYESDKENGYAFFEPVTLADGSGRDAWWCYRNVGIELGGIRFVGSRAICADTPRTAQMGLSVRLGPL